jgi:hypothetical protein
MFTIRLTEDPSSLILTSWMAWHGGNRFDWGRRSLTESRMGQIEFCLWLWESSGSPSAPECQERTFETPSGCAPELLPTRREWKCPFPCSGTVLGFFIGWCQARLPLISPRFLFHGEIETPR